MTVKRIYDSFTALSEYCEKQAYKGYDPYDGLNSALFQGVPFLKNNRIARLIWIQFFKKSPVNLRPFTGVKKDYNPKGMGLFLSGFCNLFRESPSDYYLDKIRYFSRKIIQLSVENRSGYCWGYNFDWQARAFFLPRNTPTVVATTFNAYSLLDAYDILGNENLLKVARSACDFIRNDLKRTYDAEGNFAFSYSPLENSVVFNASLLGSRLLARVYSYTNEKELIDDAGKSVAFCIKHQNEDGSWSYGLLPYHQWIDSFHTGYNLECVSDFLKYSKENRYGEHLAKGLEYYVNTFFTDEGVPKYYNNSVYPIDIHAPAQMVVTLSRLGVFHRYKSLIDRVLIWTIENMRSSKGYFYYQRTRLFSSKISYIRWAQAWMFYAFSEYILQNTLIIDNES